MDQWLLRKSKTICSIYLSNKMWCPSRVYSRSFESLIFADDTSIFYSHSDPNYLESMMNDELKIFDVWMKCNKLSVNILKNYNYIILKSNRKQIRNNFSLCYDNEMLKQKTIKFLGVYIYEHLTWKQHICYVSKKISKSVCTVYYTGVAFIYQLKPKYISL